MSDWIATSEALPDTRRRVLVYTVEEGIMEAVYDQGIQGWRRAGFIDIHSKVFFWREMPPEPDIVDRLMVTLELVCKYFTHLVNKTSEALSSLEGLPEVDDDDQTEK